MGPFTGFLSQNTVAQIVLLSHRKEAQEALKGKQQSIPLVLAT